MKNSPWTWVLIVFLVCATRLGELGIAMDPSLFASIARTFSRDWDWWSLSANPSLFPQYYEHPFLPIWIQGIVFHFLGASELTSRLVGLFFGSLTFYYLWQLGKELVDQRFAAILCFLTLFSIYFTGRIPTFYTEVPLTFFMVASLYYFYRDRGWLSGGFLAAAFLSKGLAALPMAAMIGVAALYRFCHCEAERRSNLVVSTARTFVFCGILVTGFCLLQHHYGQYSFIEKYLEVSLFQKALPGGQWVFPSAFLAKFFETHALHVVLALAAWPLAWREKPLREVLVVGTAGTFLFLAAGGSLNKTFLHYYFPIYPVSNLVAAVALYRLTVPYWQFRWQRAAAGFALFYLVLWHVLPNHMRRKAAVDYYQLSGPVKALKDAGVPRLESLGIPWQNWNYRERSFWYWDMETALRSTPDEVEGRAVIFPQTFTEIRDQLENRGYVWCSGSPEFGVMVDSAELQKACRTAGLPKDIIR